MEKKKIEFNKITKNTGKKMKTIYEKTKENVIKVVDQNDDGTFDTEDVYAIKERVGDLVKKTSDSIMMTVDEKRRTLEKERLKPVFAEDLSDASFNLPKLLRITDISKKYADSDVCQNAIGYMRPQKGIDVINLFKNEIDLFGLTFIPDKQSEIYYVDPSDQNKYIALEDYFDYLKIVRVNELQKIAQDLGARYFKVTYKEHKAKFTSNKGKVKAGAKIGQKSASAEMERDISSTEINTIEVAAEMNCPGHEPFEPKLEYLKREPSIQSLIALRMDKDSPITHHKFTLKLINSSGIKEKDAIKIDAALKAMKISGNTTFASEVRNESRRIFEYEVDF